jgi:hypothetical protein
MYVCMYVCMYMYILHMYIYICTYVYIYITHTHTQTHPHMHAYIHIHTSRRQEPGLDLTTWHARHEASVDQRLPNQGARTRVVHYKRVERVDTAQILKSTLHSDFYIGNILGH